jgi:hypothetical protein
MPHTHTNTDTCLLPIYGVIFPRTISFFLSETQSSALSPRHLTSPAFGSPSTTFLQPQPSLLSKATAPINHLISSSPLFPALFWFSSCLPSPSFYSLSVCHDVAFYDKIRFHDPKTRRHEMRTSFFSFGGHQLVCVHVYMYIVFFFRCLLDGRRFNGCRQGGSLIVLDNE